MVSLLAGGWGVRACRSWYVVVPILGSLVKGLLERDRRGEEWSWGVWVRRSASREGEEVIYVGGWGGSPWSISPSSCSASLG